MSQIEAMKYPIKWGIRYGDRTYLEVYGKKRAYDLLYSLSSCVNGLTVVPLHPKKKWNKYSRK
ncbi:hypothetical protein RAC89_07740 [Paenibacillus sp. GD4]|jgi:hypothetical protein|uniref:hypothetical protein n=1 Tax=Paenibacillus TaxID=44249 RepID=UPI002543CB75|nr:MULTISPECIES: hypothetical protein [Paenibacillus]MDQ1910387.1 hypothetical protein [Paenibacillus sp. GD4]